MKKNFMKGIIVAAILILGFAFYQMEQRPDGRTVESRTEMLNDDSHGIAWSIAKEQKLGDYIISGIYSETQAGIAVFKPDGNGKYRLSSSNWQGMNDIIIKHYPVEGEWYNIIWFNGAQTDHAELTYTINGVKEEPLVFDTSDMQIICNPPSATDYNLEVIYYDSEGNVYE